ncbi:Small Multidrug Resistance protein [Duganella sacchari]|uniref:Small Multidrug Resistance protein n=1 Tax=Duganella sacchari TaxID=551987 RepID=A0A1M7R8C7_9BURK|nr:EamA family transporter [Duganella sacchari]SHN42587.1 Small Multidrug Resistance protein [Duganella sacchari]
MNYLYIVMTIVLTVFGQLAIKMQVSKAGALPADAGDKLWFLIKLLLNPWIIAAFAAAFLASVSWMGAMTKFQLSHAYPFMALNFVIVLLLSAWMFNEPLSVTRIAGVALICIGTVVAAQG